MNLFLIYVVLSSSYSILPAPFCLAGVGVLSFCGLAERPCFLSSELSPFTLHVCPDWNSNHNKTWVKPRIMQTGNPQRGHGDSPIKFHYVCLDALSDQQPPSEEEAGSGRASGPGPPLQAAPALSVVPDLTGQPKPGPSAGTVSGGRLGGSGAVWGEPEVEEVVVVVSALVGMRSVAAEQPPEEEAEAGRWQLGLRSELMMQARWWQMEQKKKKKKKRRGCWEWSFF